IFRFRQFDQFSGLNFGKPIDARDTVADFEHSAHVVDGGLRFHARELLTQDGTYFIRSDLTHDSSWDAMIDCWGLPFYLQGFAELLQLVLDGAVDDGVVDAGLDSAAN